MANGLFAQLTQTHNIALKQNKEITKRNNT